MEQKPLIPSIQIEIDEIKALLNDSVNNELIALDDDPKTTGLAAEIASDMVKLQDKFAQLAYLYPLYRGNTLFAFQKMLSENKNQIKRILEEKPITIKRLKQVIDMLFSLSIQGCLQVEMLLIYQSIDDISFYAEAPSRKDFSTATATIKTILQKATEFIALSIEANQGNEINLTMQSNTSRLFELFDEINQKIIQLDFLCQKDHPDLMKTIFCVISLSKIIENYSKDIEINVTCLVELFNTIHSIFSSLEKRLQPNDNTMHSSLLVENEEEILVARKLFFDEKPAVEIPVTLFMDTIDQYPTPLNVSIVDQSAKLDNQINKNWSQNPMLFENSSDQKHSKNKYSSSSPTPLDELETQLIILNKSIVQQVERLFLQIEFLTEEEIIDITYQNNTFFELYNEAIKKIKKIKASIPISYHIDLKIKMDSFMTIDQLSHEKIQLDQIVDQIKEIIVLLDKIEITWISHEKDSTINTKSPQKKPFTFSISSKKQKKNTDNFKKLNEVLLDFTGTHDEILNKPFTLSYLETLPNVKKEMTYSLQDNFCVSCMNVKQTVDKLSALWSTCPSIIQGILIRSVNQWCNTLVNRIQNIKKIDQWNTSLANWLKGEIKFLENLKEELNLCYIALTTKGNQTIPIQLDNSIHPTSLIQQKIHCFRFFDLPHQTRANGFYIATNRETHFKHLAHFYLICKDWSISAHLVKDLPENHINFILWWVLQLATEEERNQLYFGRTGGLAVTTDPLPCQISFKETENGIPITKFFTVRRVVPPSSPIADATLSTAPSLPTQSPSITDPHESCPPRQNF